MNISLHLLKGRESSAGMMLSGGDAQGWSCRGEMLRGDAGQRRCSVKLGLSPWHTWGWWVPMLGVTLGLSLSSSQAGSKPL